MQPTVLQSSFIMNVTSKHISELMLGTLFKRTFQRLIKSIRVEVAWNCPFLPLVHLRKVSKPPTYLRSPSSDKKGSLKRPNYRRGYITVGPLMYDMVKCYMQNTMRTVTCGQRDILVWMRIRVFKVYLTVLLMAETAHRISRTNNTYCIVNNGEAIGGVLP
jgi:hypothetical protein